MALVYAHPYPDRSRANRALLEAVRDLPGLDVRPLFDLYPDYDLDVAAEQRALVAAHTVVWQHPLHWYSVPGLLKLWFDQVLARGFAYGGGRALAGKRCLWVVTTGGELDAYGPSGMHGHPFAEFEPPIRQTARFCGMEWLEPIVVHGAHHVSDTELARTGERYRARLAALEAEGGARP
ncbi:MAG: NAD(P)H-dependent oxidoreductase [Myxococcales bacterium]|nr:NAD(P)H-dependent oxidoreductase [Myxococcales bacterium]